MWNLKNIFKNVLLHSKENAGQLKGTCIFVFSSKIKQYEGEKVLSRRLTRIDCQRENAYKRNAFPDIFCVPRQHETDKSFLFFSSDFSVFTFHPVYFFIFRILSPTEFFYQNSFFRFEFKKL